MGNEKLTWVIKNFSSLESRFILSNDFVIGGCKWFLVAYPKGNQNANYLSLYLFVADSTTLPSGWRRNTRFRLTVVNQISDYLSVRRETERWFNQKIPLDGFQEMISLTRLNAKIGGFLVNNQVKIVVEVSVLQVIGKLDVFEESNHPRKRMRLDGDGRAMSIYLHKETSSVDVNGFQLLPTQEKSVKRIFERHPDMALEFRAKKQSLRTSCIDVLLNVIETLCQSLKDLSTDDLGQAEKALTYLKDSGFKVDWLERKLEEVKEKKIEEQLGKTRMQELEEDLKVLKNKCSDMETELKDLKQKCSDTEALLEKEKTKVLTAARAPPLTFYDVVW